MRKTAQVILNALEYPDGELSILIVDDSQIAELNQEYLNRSGPTNVIAFPMKAGEFANISPALLGDVVISVETACREGELAGIGWEGRLSELMIHGILHLLDYDHERTDAEASQMEAKSKQLLGLIANE